MEDLKRKKKANEKYRDLKVNIYTIIFFAHPLYLIMRCSCANKKLIVESDVCILYDQFPLQPVNLKVKTTLSKPHHLLHPNIRKRCYVQLTCYSVRLWPQLINKSYSHSTLLNYRILHGVIFFFYDSILFFNNHIFVLFIWFIQQFQSLHMILIV